MAQLPHAAAGPVVVRYWPVFISIIDKFIGCFRIGSLFDVMREEIQIEKHIVVK